MTVEKDDHNIGVLFETCGVMVHLREDGAQFFRDRSFRKMEDAEVIRRLGRETFDKYAQRPPESPTLCLVPKENHGNV